MNYIDQIAEQIKQALPKDLYPNEDSELLFRLYAVLALTLGQKVEAKDVHDAWSAWMSQSNPAHESIVPFANLSANVQAQDEPFVDAIRKVSAS
ncbi:DUF7701 domain-containing protein [Rubrobacter aplysinae]